MKIDKSLMTGSTTLLILSLLSREEMYGYQMITELARRSDHTFELKEGTLYPILHSREAARLVTGRQMEADTERSGASGANSDAGRSGAPGYWATSGSSRTGRPLSGS